MTPVPKNLSAPGKGCTSAYALHRACDASAVNVVLSVIDDDGQPLPMIDRKQVQPTTQSSTDKAPRELPPRCPSCGRFLKREKKRDSKSKPYRKNNRNHSRVTKHRTKPLRIRSATRSIIRAGTNKSCQYVPAKKYNASTRITKMDTSPVHGSCSVEGNDTTVLFERTSKSNDGSGNKSNPSISNYSSFTSIEHEPMVSP